MLSRETWRSSFGVVGDRVLLGVGHATALHSGRPRDILCGKTNPNPLRGRRLVLYDAEGDFDRNFDWWKELGECRLVEFNRHSKTAAAICSRAAAAGWTSRTSTCLLPFSSMLSTRVTGMSSACSSRRRWKHCSERHLLNGLVDAPWVRTDDPESDDDDGLLPFPRACAYAFEESAVSRRKVAAFGAGTRNESGHLAELQEVEFLLRNTAVS